MTTSQQDLLTAAERPGRVVLERVLQIKKGGVISQCPLKLRTPVIDVDNRCWKAEIECDLFGDKPLVARGEDAFQSMILALRLTKAMINMSLESHVNVYWLEEGDACGLDGIEEPKRCV